MTFGANLNTAIDGCQAWGAKWMGLLMRRCTKISTDALGNLPKSVIMDSLINRYISAVQLPQFTNIQAVT